jgi:hypothetical protein
LEELKNEGEITESGMETLNLGLDNVTNQSLSLINYSKGYELVN